MTLSLLSNAWDKSSGFDTVGVRGEGRGKRKSPRRAQSSQRPAGPPLSELVLPGRLQPEGRALPSTGGSAWSAEFLTERSPQDATVSGDPAERTPAQPWLWLWGAGYTSRDTAPSVQPVAQGHCPVWMEKGLER